ncbi:MAG: hypothetical protein OXD33_09155 [Rhodobacteraceae bacterium]|nr:hypothetical protein [Paracoccaceae bacterium]
MSPENGRQTSDAMGIDVAALHVQLNESIQYGDGVPVVTALGFGSRAVVLSGFVAGCSGLRSSCHDGFAAPVYGAVPSG